MSSGAFVIEVRGETAGLVLVDGRQFQFAAVEQAFMPLDGQLYRSVRQAQRAADDLWRQFRKNQTENASATGRIAAVGRGRPLDADAVLAEAWLFGMHL